jgi:prefoldin beta subunit
MSNVEANIAQLQSLEQNLRNIDMQKQNMQLQLMESENSLKELKEYSGKTYKIVGPVMVESNKDTLLKDLTDKEGVLKVRLETLEKQEKTLREQFQNIQNELMKDLNKEKK